MLVLGDGGGGDGCWCQLSVVSLFSVELGIKLCYMRWHFLHHPTEVIDCGCVILSMVMMTSAVMNTRLAKYLALVVLSRLWRIVTLINSISKKRAGRVAHQLANQIKQLQSENAGLKQQLSHLKVTVAAQNVATLTSAQQQQQSAMMMTTPLLAGSSQPLPSSSD